MNRAAPPGNPGKRTTMLYALGHGDRTVELTDYEESSRDFQNPHHHLRRVTLKMAENIRSGRIGSVFADGQVWTAAYLTDKSAIRFTNNPDDIYVQLTVHTFPENNGGEPQKAYFPTLNLDQLADTYSRVQPADVRKPEESHEKDFANLRFVSRKEGEIPVYHYWVVPERGDKETPNLNNVDIEMSDDYEYPKVELTQQQLDARAIDENSADRQHETLRKKFEHLKSCPDRRLHPPRFFSDQADAKMENQIDPRSPEFEHELVYYSNALKNINDDVSTYDWMTQEFSVERIYLLDASLHAGLQDIQAEQTKLYRELLRSEPFRQLKSNAVLKYTMAYFGLPVQPLTRKDLQEARMGESPKTGLRDANAFDKDGDDDEDGYGSKIIWYSEKPLEFLDTYHERNLGYPMLRRKLNPHYKPAPPVIQQPVQLKGGGPVLKLRGGAGQAAGAGHAASETIGPRTLIILYFSGGSRIIKNDFQSVKSVIPCLLGRSPNDDESFTIDVIREIDVKKSSSYVRVKQNNQTRSFLFTMSTFTEEEFNAKIRMPEGFGQRYICRIRGGDDPVNREYLRFPDDYFVGDVIRLLDRKAASVGVLQTDDFNGAGNATSRQTQVDFITVLTKLLCPSIPFGRDFHWMFNGQQGLFRPDQGVCLTPQLRKALWEVKSKDGKQLISQVAITEVEVDKLRDVKIIIPGYYGVRYYPFRRDYAGVPEEIFAALEDKVKREAIKGLRVWESTEKWHLPDSTGKLSEGTYWPFRADANLLDDAPLAVFNRSQGAVVVKPEFESFTLRDATSQTSPPYADKPISTRNVFWQPSSPVPTLAEFWDKIETLYYPRIPDQIRIKRLYDENLSDWFKRDYTENIWKAAIFDSLDSSNIFIEAWYDDENTEMVDVPTDDEDLGDAASRQRESTFELPRPFAQPTPPQTPRLQQQQGEEERRQRQQERRWQKEQREQQQQEDEEERRAQATTTQNQGQQPLQPQSQHWQQQPWGHKPHTLQELWEQAEPTQQKAAQATTAQNQGQQPPQPPQPPPPLQQEQQTGKPSYAAWQEQQARLNQRKTAQATAAKDQGKQPQPPQQPPPPPKKEPETIKEKKPPGPYPAPKQQRRQGTGIRNTVHDPVPAGPSNVDHKYRAWNKHMAAEQAAADLKHKSWTEPLSVCLPGQAPKPQIFGPAKEATIHGGRAAPILYHHDVFKTPTQIEEVEQELYRSRYDILQRKEMCTICDHTFEPGPLHEKERAAHIAEHQEALKSAGSCPLCDFKGYQFMTREQRKQHIQAFHVRNVLPIAANNQSFLAVRPPVDPREVCYCFRCGSYTAALSAKEKARHEKECKASTKAQTLPRMGEDVEKEIKTRFPDYYASVQEAVQKVKLYEKELSRRDEKKDRKTIFEIDYPTHWLQLQDLKKKNEAAARELERVRSEAKVVKYDSCKWCGKDFADFTLEDILLHAHKHGITDVERQYVKKLVEFKNTTEGYVRKTISELEEDIHQLKEKNSELQDALDATRASNSQTSEDSNLKVIVELEDQVFDLTKELEDEQALRAQDSQTILKLREQISGLQQKLEAEQALRNEVTRLNEEVLRLHGQKTRLKKELKDERVLRKAPKEDNQMVLETALADAQGNLHDAIVALDDARKEHSQTKNKLGATIRALENELSSKKEDLSRCREKVSEIEVISSRSSEEQQQQANEKDGLLAQIRSLKGEVGRLNNELTKAQNELRVKQAKFADLDPSSITMPDIARNCPLCGHVYNDNDNRSRYQHFYDSHIFQHEIVDNTTVAAGADAPSADQDPQLSAYADYDIDSWQKKLEDTRPPFWIECEYPCETPCPQRWNSNDYKRVEELRAAMQTHQQEHLPNTASETLENAKPDYWTCKMCLYKRGSWSDDPKDRLDKNKLDIVHWKHRIDTHIDEAHFDIRDHIKCPWNLFISQQSYEIKERNNEVWDFGYMKRRFEHYETTTRMERGHKYWWTEPHAKELSKVAKGAGDKVEVESDQDSSDEESEDSSNEKSEEKGEKGEDEEEEEDKEEAKSPEPEADHKAENENEDYEEEDDQREPVQERVSLAEHESEVGDQKGGEEFEFEDAHNAEVLQFEDEHTFDPSTVYRPVSPSSKESSPQPGLLSGTTLVNSDEESLPELEDTSGNNHPGTRKDGDGDISVSLDDDDIFVEPECDEITISAEPTATVGNEESPSQPDASNPNPQAPFLPTDQDLETIYRGPPKSGLKWYCPTCHTCLQDLDHINRLNHLKPCNPSNKSELSMVSMRPAQANMKAKVYSEDLQRSREVISTQRPTQSELLKPRSQTPSSRIKAQTNASTANEPEISIQKVTDIPPTTSSKPSELSGISIKKVTDIPPTKSMTEEIMVSGSEDSDESSSRKRRYTTSSGDEEADPEGADDQEDTGEWYRSKRRK